MAAPVATWETITPAIAREAMEKNKNNRLLRQEKINLYARAMLAGNWDETGDSIKYNGDNVLDGQHRFLACILANTSFRTLVVRGVPKAAHRSIDTGTPRTAADELRWVGCSDAAGTAAVLSLSWRWALGEQNNPRVRPSNGEVVEVWAADPAIVKSATQAARRQWEATHIPVSVTGAVYLKLADLFDQNRAEAWTAHLTAGTDYRAGDPALALQRYAMRVATIKAMRPRQIEWLAVVIKAVNGWLLGAAVQQLRWRTTGWQAEEFPVMLTPADLGEED